MLDVYLSKKTCKPFSQFLGYVDKVSSNLCAIKTHKDLHYFMPSSY